MAAYSRRVVQVEMGFLQRLAVVALWIRKTEQSLFEEVARSCQFGTTTSAVSTYSFSFQNEKAMFCRPWESQTPAMPSSPQRKARDRAMPCVKSVELSAKSKGKIYGY